MQESGVYGTVVVQVPHALDAFDRVSQGCISRFAAPVRLEMQWFVLFRG